MVLVIGIIHIHILKAGLKAKIIYGRFQIQPGRKQIFEGVSG